MQLPGDVQNAIEKKRDKMYELGLPVQPFIVLVGPDISTSVEKIYVCIDGRLCESPSVLKALDIALKTFLAYHVRYPPESEHLWYLLQWGIYEIQTTSDEKIPSIFNIINKIKKRRMN